MIIVDIDADLLKGRITTTNHLGMGCARLDNAVFFSEEVVRNQRRGEPPPRMTLWSALNLYSSCSAVCLGNIIYLMSLRSVWPSSTLVPRTFSLSDSTKRTH